MTPAQIEAGFANQRTGVQKAVRPFSGEATPENLVDYLNREVFPALKAGREKLNEIFLQVTDNAPSANPLGYYFSTLTTGGDPTAGRLKLDQATQDTAATIRLSQSNGRLVDAAFWLDVMAGGPTTPLGVVTLSDAINPQRFIRWDLDTMTDQGDYWDLGVTVIESSHDNPFVDGGAVVLAFIPGVSAAGSTVGAGALTPIADDTVLANISGAVAAPSAIALADFGGTGIDYNATTHAFDAVSVPLTSLADITGPALLGLQTGTGPPEALTGGEAGHLIKKAGDVEATISADQNDWSPTNLSIADTLNVQVSGANRTVTGFDSSVFEELHGTEIVVRTSHATAFALTLANNSGSSLAANRIHCPGSVNYLMTSAEHVTLRYASLGGLTGWHVIPNAPRLSGTQIIQRGRGASINATIAATTNDWAPFSSGTQDAVRVTLTGNQTITGISVAAFQVFGEAAAGKEFWIMNVDTVDTLTLASLSASSLSANRFITPLGVDLLVPPGGVVKGRIESSDFRIRLWPLMPPAPARAVLANLTNAASSFIPAQPSAGLQALMSNSGNTALAWRSVALTDLPAQAADTFVGNITTGSAVPVAVPLASVDSTSVVYDTATGTFQRAALTGDVTAAQNVNATTIANNAVTNTKAAQMATDTIKSNITTATANAADNTFNSVAVAQGLRQTVFTLYDEMFSFNVSYLSGNDAVGQWRWQLTDADEGQFFGIASEANHPGIIRILAPANASTPVIDIGGADSLGSGTSIDQISIADVAWLRFIVRVPNLLGTEEDLVRYGIGLISSSASGELQGNTPNLGNLGLVLWYSSGVDPAWQIRDENASAGTNFDTNHTLVVGQWVECVLVNLGGGSWDVFMNGVDTGTTTGVATSGMVYAAAWIHSADGTGADKNFDIDRFEIGVLPAGNRFG